MTDSVPVVMVLDPNARAQAVTALRLWEREARRNGIRPHPQLVELGRSLAASFGQPVPKVEVLAAVADDGPVTYKTAARLLGISERSVRRMVADGRLPAFRLGRSVRISREAIKELTG